MTEAEALEVLQLTAGATPDAIEEAHGRLMQRLDPEQGGSSCLAELVNRAKAVLLGLAGIAHGRSARTRCNVHVRRLGNRSWDPRMPGHASARPTRDCGRVEPTLSACPIFRRRLSGLALVRSR